MVISFIFAVLIAAPKDKLIKYYSVIFKRGGGGGEGADNRGSVNYHVNSQAVGEEVSSKERACLIR